MQIPISESLYNWIVIILIIVIFGYSIHLTAQIKFRKDFRVKRKLAQILSENGIEDLEQ